MERIKQIKELQLKNLIYNQSWNYYTTILYNENIVKKILKFIISHYYFTIISSAIIFVTLVLGYKILFTKPTYIYVKVKIGHGYWWVSSGKPTIWLVEGLKKAKPEKDIYGNSLSEIEDIEYYTLYPGDSADVYLTLKLRVTENKRKNQYMYKRSAIGIGSPIQLEFSTIQVNGAIIDLNTSKIEDKYIEKTIVLTKKNAFAWEFDAITIGDKYFDGKQTVFEIINKNSINTSTLTSDYYGNTSPWLVEANKYITITAKVKVKEKNDLIIFGEEQVIKLGKDINISTPNFTFDNYIVSEIK